jgi:hypothetical protein
MQPKTSKSQVGADFCCGWGIVAYEICLKSERYLIFRINKEKENNFS